MTEVFQRLTKSSWRDRLDVAFWTAIVVPAILAPIEFVLQMVPLLIAALVSLFALSFASAMQNKGFSDPVYKKNLQRLIDRNRQFEEARKAGNEPHS